MQQPAALLELQGIDVELLRLDKRLDELPEKKAILESRAKQKETSDLRDKANLLVRKLEAEVKARQDEIATVTEKIATEQAKLMGTSDHRQVQAITREMDGLKRRVDKLEMETLGFVDRSEKASGQVTAIEGHIEKMAQHEAALTEAFKKVGGELQSEISTLHVRRDALAAQISADLLARYDAVRESKGGVGVGRLIYNDGVNNGGTCSCSACRMELPAERIRDLESGDDVGICPHCRRLIVVRTGEAE